VLVNYIAAIISALLAFSTFTQSGASDGPLRTAPTEKFTVNPGFRDWTPTTISGSTIVGGNSSNRGGLFAVDTIGGKLKWSARPTGTARGNPFVATRPVVSGDIVIAPMGETLMALNLATGKEVWRGPVTEQSAAAAAGGGTAFVMGADNNFYALDAATGKEKWKMTFARGYGSCYSTPVFRDGTVYVNGSVVVTPADANRAATYSRQMFALDAATGKERWRYRVVSAPSGACLEQPIVTADTLFAVSEATLYAVDLATGRDRWKPTEVRATVEGRDRAQAVFGLVDADQVLIGLTRNALLAFEKTSGKTAWQVPGQYRENSPSTAVSGRVLYFQGHPGAKPADEVQGRILYVGGKPVEPSPALPPGKLNALDLDTRAILWSFSRPTAEANWPFGFVTPVDRGLWVDSYQALVKLQ
jgi:outer membrane protein assembly factor BamB